MAYAPASNKTTTASLAHFAAQWYDREGLDVLRATTIFDRLHEIRDIPRRNGKTVQWFRYGTFGSNTTAHPEGEVGTGLELTSTTVSATVSQYVDWLSFSDLVVATAIDDIVANGVRELSYRAALTVDDIIKAEVDSAAASIDVTPQGEFFSSKDLAKVAHLLAGDNTRAMSNGYFPCLAHPYVTYDLLHDPVVGSIQDLTKRGNQVGQNLQTRNERGLVARFSNVEVFQTTQVTKVTGSPNKWRAYFAGRGGLGFTSISGMSPSRVRDALNERFRIMVRRYGVDKSDPAGVISATASYNFTAVSKILDTNPYRLRKIDLPSSIVA